jgi:hypothetical protein
MIAAETIVARARTEKVSKPALASAKRIQKLLSSCTYDLLAEKAPYRVFRWVAWGKTITERGQRADLAVHLHHTFRRRAGRWLDDVQHAAALEVWKRARAERWTRPEEVDTALYAAALAAVPKRRRAPKPPAPLPGEEEAMQVLRGVREQLEQKAASQPRRPPTFKVRVPKAQDPAQAQQAQAMAEQERRHSEAEKSREREFSALRIDKLQLESENRRLRSEVEQLRLERRRDTGVSWLDAAAIGVGGFAAGAVAMAASQQTAEGAATACPHCAAALSPPAQAPPAAGHAGDPPREEGVPAVPDAREQRPE